MKAHQEIIDKYHIIANKGDMKEVQYPYTTGLNRLETIMILIQIIATNNMNEKHMAMVF